MQNEHINALKNGTIVAEYRIEGLLGHGGFGMTYLARDLNLNSMVAIKEYLPQEFAVRAANSTIVPKSQVDGQGYEWGLERFKQEARALARFKHPNIVRCARLIEANNTAYMVMDYEQGMSLSDFMKKHVATLAEAQILGIFIPILDGLTALHETELIHRDIKPGNLYIRAQGQPMLIDFGAVRHAIGAHSRSLTAVVTPGYAPIEQYSSEGKQGPWTDLYAIGATMYTCILGRSPVDAARRSAAISDGDPDPFVSAARIGKGKYSDQILAAVDWAMQFRTRDRPQTAAEFKAALQRVPVAPAPLEIPDEDGDSEVTNIGARPGTQRASQPPSQRGATGIPPAIDKGADSNSRSQQKRMIPAPVEEPEEPDAAPSEWFDAPAEPVVPHQPTQLVSAPVAPAVTAERSPTRRIPPAAEPRAEPAPAPPPREDTRRDRPRPAATPPRAATPPAEPPTSGGGRVLPIAAALLLAAGAAAAAYWFVQQSAGKREQRLWETAQRADTVDAYRTYLDVCEACAAKTEAERRLQNLQERAAVETRSNEQLQAIADLKVRFAQHLIAGEYRVPLDSNANSVLAQLAVLAPDDPFVTTGRTQLARLEQPVAPIAAPKPTKGAAAIVAVPPAGVDKSAAAKPKGSTVKQPVAPAAGTAPAPAVAASAPPAAPPDKVGQMFDLLAKFELGMARADQDTALVAAGAALKELEVIAPGDSAVKDARRRYDAAKNKPAPVVAAAAVIAAPSAIPSGAPLAIPASGAAKPSASPPASTPPASVVPPSAIPAGSALKPPAAGPPPGVLPSGNAPRVAVGGAITNSRPPEKVLRVKIDGKWDAPPLAVLPAGSFRLGDTAGGGKPDEQSAGSVKVGAFAIGLREVTRAEFKRFAEESKYQTDAEKKGGCMAPKGGKLVKDGNLNWRRVPADQGDDHPVTCVSYKDALAYTTWLSKQTDRNFRLPTEREWEYAARGGSDNNYWWGGGVAEGGANCDGCGGRSAPRPLAAASLLPNPFGLNDTAGNVAELTCTVYTPKVGDGEPSCQNLQLGLRPFATPPSIAIRGGSFALPAERARSSARQNAPANEPRFDTGFRVALDP